jgi:membrane protease YdiL (CAAX protease family)
VRAPSPLGCLFLGHLLVLLPLGGIKARRLNAGPRPPITKIWTTTLVSLVVLFLIAFVTGRAFDFEAFAVPALGAREIGLGFGALALTLGVATLLRALRSEEERRLVADRSLAPRTAREWPLYVAVCVAAGISEELAYRGVGVALLTWVFEDDARPAIALSAIAFAVAHARQGVKNVLAIFAIALVFQGLVHATDTLVIAMVVHALHDLIQGWRALPRSHE